MVKGVALAGFMGVGKSTVGRRLAERLDLPFVDLDAVLGARHGPPARQIAEEGEAVFRAREAAALAELVDGAPRVLATGGGAVIDPASRTKLREGYHLVVLEAPLEVLAGRVGQDPSRPLWDGTVAARYAARAAAYADRDLGVDTSRRTPDEVVEEIVTWLDTRR